MTYSVQASFCLQFAFTCDLKQLGREFFPFTIKVKKKSRIIHKNSKFELKNILAPLWVKDIHTFIQNGPTSVPDR